MGIVERLAERERDDRPPATAAAIGTDTRVLIEKSTLPRASVDTFATFTPMENRPSPQSEDPVARLEGLLVWFWSMYGPLAGWRP